MTLVKHDLTTAGWTLIGDNVATISVQNAGQFPYYLNFNATNSAPSENFGFIRHPGEAPITKAAVTSLTHKATPNYVFAKALSKNTSVIVETP